LNKLADFVRLNLGELCYILLVKYVENEKFE